MQYIQREALQKHNFPGRIIQKAVGRDGFSISEKMTMGFARFSRESGSAPPHQHAEETCYILDARKAVVRYGTGEEELYSKLVLEPGMVLHIPELEWHVFECEDDGYLDIIFFYGQVDNIRPEEMQRDTV
jgi:hypothetical protein